MPVIHGAGTCERLMLSYANGMRFELPTLSARRRGEISPHYAYIFRILHIARARARMQVKITVVGLSEFSP